MSGETTAGGWLPPPVDAPGRPGMVTPDQAYIERWIREVLAAENAAIDRAAEQADRQGCGIFVQRGPTRTTIVVDGSVPAGELHERTWVTGPADPAVLDVYDAPPASARPYVEMFAQSDWFVCQPAR